MSDVKYKLLINPYNARKVFLREIKVVDGITQTRDWHEKDLKNWTASDFIEKLTESGYGKSAINFVAAKKHLFKREEEE